MLIIVVPDSVRIIGVSSPSYTCNNFYHAIVTARYKLLKIGGSINYHVYY